MSNYQIKKITALLAIWIIVLLLGASFVVETLTFEAVLSLAMFIGMCAKAVDVRLSAQ